MYLNVLYNQYPSSSSTNRSVPAVASTEPEFDVDLSEYLHRSEHRPGSGTYRFEYDRERTLPSTAVVAALSEVTGTPPTSLGPLYDAVDTDALDALVGDRDAANGDVGVTFPIGGYAVTAHGRGTVTVAPQESAPADARNAEGRHG